MANATRLGDKSTGHDACAPTPLVTASNNVYINGRGAGRMTDLYESHGCIVHSAHQDTITSGSSSVYINGLPAARVGDSLELGGTVAEGSANVNIGG